MERRTDRGDHCGEGVTYGDVQFIMVVLTRKNGMKLRFTPHMKLEEYPCAFWCKSSAARL